MRYISAIHEEQIEEPLEKILKPVDTLYHGSPVAGIQRLNPAEENTVGDGVYFTDDINPAIGYACVRSQSGGTPTVYSVHPTRELRIVNLNNQQILDEVMGGYTAYLKSKLSNLKPESSWWASAALHKTLGTLAVRPIVVGRVKDATHQHGPDFTAYLQSLGYDGLKTPEGGENGANGTGDHQSIVIFNPNDVEIADEQLVSDKKWDRLKLI